jgi:hypothetical protein
MDTLDVNVGDTVKCTINATGPAPSDPHPENPSVTTTTSHDFEGEVVEIKESGVMVDTAKKGTMRFKRDEIVSITDRAEDAREPITFEANSEDYKAVWTGQRYEVKESAQFDVWADADGEVHSRLDVYKGVDPRVRDDVRKKKRAVAEAFKQALA